MPGAVTGGRARRWPAALYPRRLSEAVEFRATGAPVRRLSEAVEFRATGAPVRRLSEAVEFRAIGSSRPYDGSPKPSMIDCPPERGLAVDESPGST
jgi:hypothetical protein